MTDVFASEPQSLKIIKINHNNMTEKIKPKSAIDAKTILLEREFQTFYRNNFNYKLF